MKSTKDNEEDTLIWNTEAYDVDGDDDGDDEDEGDNNDKSICFWLTLAHLHASSNRWNQFATVTKLLRWSFVYLYSIFICGFSVFVCWSFFFCFFECIILFKLKSDVCVAGFVVVVSAVAIDAVCVFSCYFSKYSVIAFVPHQFLPFLLQIDLVFFSCRRNVYLCEWTCAGLIKINDYVDEYV